MSLKTVHGTSENDTVHVLKHQTGIHYDIEKVCEGGVDFLHTVDQNGSAVPESLPVYRQLKHVLRTNALTDVTAPHLPQ